MFHRSLQIVQIYIYYIHTAETHILQFDFQSAPPLPAMNATAGPQALREFTVRRTFWNVNLIPVKTEPLAWREKTVTRAYVGQVSHGFRNEIDVAE